MPDDYTPSEAAERLLHGDVQLIDVRTPHEFAAGHIPAAVPVPLQELAASITEIDRERPVILVCRSGGRSAMATEALRQAGFDAHNLLGGMLDWTAAGLAIEPASGSIIEP
ncbi:rhodanese-like domain-containing protein [Conexibacter sp. DBS9H8]|uniref:rhodanese-like domain-containing protein n=1 Tax=Conexibacter sp. DBS9H8 TaxID=2937801 RepID=UPI00200C9EE0|nr:rhodanese-like domain-containing protein [Conexibacter sp. DBS9H8]